MNGSLIGVIVLSVSVLVALFIDLLGCMINDEGPAF